MNFEVKNEGGFSYIDEGKGHTLVLLHGLFGALSNWGAVISKFSENYRVIIPLMPVYDMPLLTTGVGSLAKFVHKFVTYKELSNFTLLGNSLGGHVSLVYTLEHPEMVHSMMLTGSSGLYENAMGGSFPKRENYDYIKTKVEYTFYDPTTASKELVDEVFGIVNSREKTLRILAMAKSAMRHNMSKELPNIKQQTCLIWGRNDTVTPPNVADEFNQLMPNSELHWIDKCGHAPMMEKPEEFNKILETFLLKVCK